MMKSQVMFWGFMCLTSSIMLAQDGYCQEHAYLIVGKHSSFIEPGARSVNLQRLELEIEGVIEQTGEAPANLLQHKERLEKANAEGSFSKYQYGAYFVFDGERLSRAKIVIGEVIEEFNVLNPGACCGNLLLFDGDSIYEYTLHNDELRVMLNQPVPEDYEGGLLYLQRSLEPHNSFQMSLLPHFLFVNREDAHESEHAANLQVERDELERVIESRQTIQIGRMDAEGHFQHSESEIIYQFNYENSPGEWPFIGSIIPSFIHLHLPHHTTNDILEIESVEAVEGPADEIFAIPYERETDNAIRSFEASAR